VLTDRVRVYVGWVAETTRTPSCDSPLVVTRRPTLQEFVDEGLSFVPVKSKPRQIGSTGAVVAGTILFNLWCDGLGVRRRCRRDPRC
jgi:hypothetical protein